jgi:hypothetical protein
MYTLSLNGKEISFEYKNIECSGRIGKTIFPLDILTAISRTDMSDDMRGTATECAVRLLIETERDNNITRVYNGNTQSVGCDCLDTMLV